MMMALMSMMINPLMMLIPKSQIIGLSIISGLIIMDINAIIIDFLD
jgi:hypothetical protein